MSDEKSKSLDVLGVKPFADAINTTTKGIVDGAGAFLGKICLPAAEEFGLFLKDKVSTWRGNNALQIVVSAEKKNTTNYIKVVSTHIQELYTRSSKKVLG